MDNEGLSHAMEFFKHSMHFGNESLDGIISYLWKDILYNNSLFRHESFEPIFASICFTIYIFGYVAIDYYMPWFHRYRIDDHVPLKEWDLKTKKAWKGRENAAWNESLWYLLPWLVIDLFWKRRILPIEAPTFYRVIRDVMSSLFVYDIFFYIGHRYMHSNHSIFKYLHSKHHLHGGDIRAGDSVRHTLIDGTFNVLCSVFALRITQAHFFSRIIYNAIAIYLIVEAHCGYDMPWSISNLLPFLGFASSSSHQLHHAKQNKNYSKFFIWLDIFFGTYEKPNVIHKD